MNILGISCFFCDSSACLVRDGQIVSAVQEERFTRKKHDFGFPINAIKWCLKENGIAVEDLDYVAFYDQGIRERFRVSFLLKKLFNYRKKVICFSQKESYAASAFYPSCFAEAAILVNDGRKVKTVFAKGTGSGIESLDNYDFSYSLGLIYSAITNYLGFKVNSDEFKIMGLSAYGKPRYRHLIINNKKHISQTNLRHADQFLSSLFTGKPRKEEAEITQQHMDIAASVQVAVEEEILKQTEYLYRATDCQNLCLSGQMALNCLINTKIIQQGFFKNLWIQPAGTDSGCALGAAWLVWHKYLGNQRRADNKNDMMKNGFIGPSFSDEDIEVFLKSRDICYRKLDYAQIPEIAADLLAQGKIIGWFQGRMEFGPRALGARSILADSRNYNMHDRINLRVKFREPFRPLAPVILAEKSDEYFDLEKESPYMLLVSQVKKGKKDEIPAVVHVDNSSRIQTIKRETHPLYHDTIEAFYKQTGCPVLINTSFNIKGEPIVCSPEDAFRCFMGTEMDCLIMGKFLLDKK